MLNKAQLIGRLGRDPEIKTMQNGKEVARLSLATSDRWKDRNGEKQERTEWHQVVVFNEGLVNLVKNYARKGKLIYVEGSITTRKWQDQSGADRYSTEIVLQPFRSAVQILEWPDDKNQSAEPAASAEELEDDIPF